MIVHLLSDFKSILLLFQTYNMEYGIQFTGFELNTSTFVPSIVAKPVTKMIIIKKNIGNRNTH